MPQRELPSSHEGQSLPDFPAIFYKKLQNINPLATQHATEEARQLGELGITRIDRKAPALIFQTGTRRNEQLDMWITDPKHIKNPEWAHHEVRIELVQEYPPDPNLHANLLLANSAAIIQANDADVYLYADFRQTELLGLDRKGNHREKPLKDLLERYGIKGIIGEGVGDSYRIVPTKEEKTSTNKSKEANY